VDHKIASHDFTNLTLVSMGAAHSRPLFVVSSNDLTG
jgi:hypothetical protein